ncbi:CIS tube protein [Sorangium sp. So ce406]|uniref:CIS tube protein n=1 Tax=Sorangium sp. So ce406 TaxID=3133311 RepID=UPI003F5B7636
MSVELRRAELVPFQESGNQADEGSKIVLDFNPETLTIRVQNSLQDVPGRKGRQRTQFVGSSTSTLTFDAYFDSTRPKNEPGEEGGEREEDLDVRERTKKIAALLQVSDPDAQHPAPRRVQFRWGSIVFEGVFDSYTEVLEYFSPEGVPLRAKVSISLKEQKFEYQVDSTKRAQLATFRGGGGSDRGAGPRGVGDALSGVGAGIGSAGDVAAQNGLDSLLDIGASASLSFDASASASVGFRAEADLELGIGIDLAASAGVSLDVSATAAVEVFGGAAVSAALGDEVDVAATARAPARAAAGPVQPPGPRPGWAPDGPAPGTRAAALAGVVHAERASGALPDVADPARGTFSATAVPPRAGAAGAPVPVRGSPPRTAARVGAAAAVVFQRPVYRPASVASLAGGRPRWEALPEGAALPTAGARACCAACGRAAVARPPGESAGCGACGGKAW